MSAQDGAASLEDRLRVVEDRLAILDLEADFAVAWERGEATRWAAVSTPNGAFEMLPSGERPGLRVEGHEALRAFCAETTAGWTGLHLMHTPKITLDGDRAQGVVFFEYKYLRRGLPGVALQATVSGTYDITYERTLAGWRMRERIEKGVLASSAASYDSGQ